MAMLTVEIYTPRWGHKDKYTFELTREAMTIKRLPRTARAVWRENRDPEWEGESIYEMLSNDSIYAPKVLQRLLEYLWRSWRDGTISDVEAQQELDQLAEWLNKITDAKPNTDFWSKYF